MKKGSWLSLRVTEEDYASYVRYAASEKRSLSDWVRIVLEEEKRKRTQKEGNHGQEEE